MSTLKATNIQNAASSSTNIVLGTSGDMTVAGTSTFGGNGTFSGTAVMSSPYTMRNKIINGAMVIDQRNAGASISGNNTSFGVDRFQVLASVNSKFNIQQNAGSVTPPAGFSNYLGVTSTSAYTAGATEVFVLVQKIEGLNIADLAYGSASAQTVTISFWVRSSLTGTFSGYIQNSAADRSYVFSYTINAANTWEQKSVTIAGDTTGTWLTSSGIGFRVGITLAAGSSSTTTAGSWVASDKYGVTGTTSIVGTNGATFYITGVQLERGTIATPFEYRNYQQELAMCQRYLPAYNTSVAANLGSSTNYTTTSATVIIPFKVSTRVAPTGITVSSQSILTVYSGGSGYAATAIAFNGASTEVGTVNLTISGATQGQAGLVNFNAAGQLLFTGCEL